MDNPPSSPDSDVEDGTHQRLADPTLPDPPPPHSSPAASSTDGDPEERTDSRPLTRQDSVKMFYREHPFAVIMAIFGAVLSVVAAIVSTTICSQVGVCGPKAPTPPVTTPTRRDYLMSLISERSPSTNLSSSTHNPAFEWIWKDAHSFEWDLEASDILDDRLMQRFALASLYYSTSGDEWTNSDGDQWLDTNQDECKWSTDGIKCSKGLVDWLALSGDNLSGPIPIEIGLLLELTSLDLHDNKLTGSIPSELGFLTKLEVLAFHENQLMGAFPSEEIGLLIELTSLDLHGNKLTGSIPSELGLLTKLEVLGLHENQLTGAFPS
jgi:hypothetical protein